MDNTPTAQVSPATQRAAQVTVAGATLALLACWGLASMTGSLALYAAAWVAAVGAASAASLLYRLWTAGRPDLQQRTLTMTLGLVGWLIVIGGGMTLFRAAASVFVEEELALMDWAAWLMPIILLAAVGVWGYCWKAGNTLDDPRLQSHAPQHLATVAALALAELGLILAQLEAEPVRWIDVLAGVVVVAVGMTWSWVRLWKRIGAAPAPPTPQGEADPALSAKARDILDAARDRSDIQNYDRLAIEQDAAGTHITVRLHLGQDLPLHAARERGRTLERALEALLPAGTATALLEPAAPQAPPATPPPPPPPPPPPAQTTAPDPAPDDNPGPDHPPGDPDDDATASP